MFTQIIVPTLIILAIAITLVLSVLFLAGQLTLRRMRMATETAARTPSHRLLDDLKGLEDALVDFFASSKVSSGILSVLAARRWPINFKALVHEVRKQETALEGAEHIPMGAIRAVLSILQLARLGHMSRSGFSITDLGREVYRRMRRKPCPPTRSRVDSFAIASGLTTKHHRMSASRRPYSPRVLGRSSALVQQ